VLTRARVTSLLSVAAVATVALTLAGAAHAALFTFGTTDQTVGTQKDNLGIGLKGVNVKMTSPKAGTITKVEGYLDGSGAGSGSEKVRIVVYDLDANSLPTTLRGVSTEMTINAGTAAGWKTFTFPSPVTVPAGKVGVGYWAGGTTNNLIRPYYETTSATCSLRYNSNTYSSTGNPSNPFGTSNCGSQNRQWSIRVTADDGVPPPLTLADRVGANVPNISTTGVSSTYGQTILADDGIHLFRDALGPLNIWSSPGAAPSWTYVDTLLNFVKNVTGGQLLPIFYGANPWQHPSCTATPGYKCGPDSAYYQEWSNEVKLTIDHAVASGVAIPEIEVWNEPYCCGFWLPSSNPAAYMALLRTLAPTLWAAYPNLKISVSANYWEEGSQCSPNCPQWFSQVISNDTTNLLNDPRIVFNIHDYVQANPPSAVLGTGWSFNRYLLARDQATAHGKVNPHFEITEYGWEADTGNVVFNDPVTEQQQSDYTVQGAHIALADSCACVDRVFIFEDYRGGDSFAQTWAYNMHRNDGTARPVAGAIKSYIQAGVP
jgi:hypothetical protein